MGKLGFVLSEELIGREIKILKRYANGTNEEVGTILKIVDCDEDSIITTTSNIPDITWTFEMDNLREGDIELIPETKQSYPGNTLQEIRDKATGGLKFDSEKPPMDLIPYEALEEIAKVLAFGEKKYATANWTKGIEMRRLLSAAMRHLGQFNNGEDFDSETQTLHLANAATNLMFAIWMYKNRKDLDNRWAKK